MTVEAVDTAASPHRKVRVAIGFPMVTDSRRPINPTIEIIDDATSEFIAQLTFTPEQFVRLLAGGTFTIDPDWVKP